MSKEEISILWLKRDLRLSDHLPLKEAIKSGHNVYALYIFEPIVENNYDFDIRHWQFVYQSIIELKETIPINLYYGNTQEVFESLHERFLIHGVYSHQETGVDITFQRDREVKELLKTYDVSWHEYQLNGVIRGLKNRTSWDAAWAKYVNTDPIVTPSLEDRFFEDTGCESLAPDFINKLKQSVCYDAGPKKAHALLQEFLEEKVAGYFKNISYPDKSRYHSSRLSANISWGNISIREIYYSCKKKRSFINNKISIDQFMARLKWHCHFVQKLEMQPDIEFKNLNPSFDHLRKKKNKVYIKAWKDGMTGYPLIDAAMRCVDETGYLNFRLRSSVVSFLTHLLWQPWQEGARILARMFIDYEPGIHFSQFQMQAGTTGINTIRVYNPVKQSKEKDKDANFIKRWVPELAKLPLEFIHEPWKMTTMEQAMFEFEYGKSYPERIVDHEKESTFARDQLWQVKKSEQNRSHSQGILDKHTRRNKRKKFNGKKSRR